ncbi:MAG: helix-turn-helix transcriptional regulator [Bacteroidales bacterium]|jgi:DNA-binding CsgD family transcriptional regulator|nr:helix-turn-helix transcriptional regulator [Bacteroidales bacterium]MBP5390305.1 helix-turn-helix transcriptional regulator [Bacteroidales bacterium]MCR5571731.1 helix-turn-helix transcriptional regulator [Bacteroidales bacterium]
MEEAYLEKPSLTKREMTILQEIALGRTTPQIAADLGLSPETVKWYRKQMLAKFSATTSAEMVRKAADYRLLQ